MPLLPKKNDGTADNNGTIVELPGVPNGGSPSASGYLVLGIGTESNNMQPASAKVLPLDDFGDFTTTLNGATFPGSFVDTGSNGLFFQVSKNSLPLCSDGVWYCPPAPFTNTAIQGGAASVTFTIENHDDLTNNTENNVFSDIGGTVPDTKTFDWGLPFYLGRNVYMGIEGESPLGPYFASGVNNGSQVSGVNVMPINVSGPVSGLVPYNNEPMVSVTVCAPGTSACQTINGILLDTGSYGLRIFKQALNGLSLPVETSQGGELAECQPYADGTADWGPVVTADVTLGGEPAVTVPIQVIDSTFQGSTNCNSGSRLDTDPSVDGYNGILGVGPFQQDCGTACTNEKQNFSHYTQWPYWSCNN